LFFRKFAYSHFRIYIRTLVYILCIYISLCIYIFSFCICILVYISSRICISLLYIYLFLFPVLCFQKFFSLSWMLYQTIPEQEAYTVQNRYIRKTQNIRNAQKLCTVQCIYSVQIYAQHRYTHCTDVHTAQKHTHSILFRQTHAHARCFLVSLAKSFSCTHAFFLHPCFLRVAYAHLPVSRFFFLLRVLFFLLRIFLLHYAYIPQKSLREAFALTHIPPNTPGKNFGVFAQ